MGVILESDDGREEFDWEVECPGCGCRDTTLLRAPVTAKEVWFASGKARCNHCGLSFNIRIAEPGPDDRAGPAGPFHY